MKIDKATLGVNVGYITDPYLIGGRRNNIFDKIGILMEPFATERRSCPPPLSINFEVLAIKEIKQSISSYMEGLWHPGVY